MAEEQEVKEVRVRPNLENYVNGVSGSGKRTKNCGDGVAVATDGFTIDEIRSVASKLLDVPVNELTDKYAHLNVGMQIMNLRNRIRGAVNKLDKAHEADKAVVPGLKTLALYTEKGQAAVAKRNAAADKAREEREKKAAAKKAADAKAKPPAKGKKAA